ncbi:LysR family transcriptional regulator [Ramlibacter sp. G-1-2-2]|uniref:LysR family transcriptional regulator n=1 Tax=Ramlibacter agri TaxID=2728837 RepID=A0A848H9K2_9BURK|nr:LysR substrate-binding domain-containing protein [Ramlibacter agri]NML47445.1 LysR family transcriptional regulator [Ramlibacter agri]
MDLTRLQYFAAVADAGSFSRAAAALHLTQPSLSRQVQLLETEVGQRLLERHGRGVAPTEAGTALLAHARAIFDLAERARVDMQERQRNPRGRLTIALPPRVAHVLTADLVERFHARFPDAGITIMEGLSLRVREWLIAGRADLAVMFDPAPSPQMHLEVLVREPLVLVSKRPLPEKLRLADLVRHRLVMPSAPNALRRLLDEHAGPRGHQLQIVAEVDSVQTVLTIVERGVADAVLPAGVPWQSGKVGKLHVAAIQAPVIRNKLTLAVPVARSATRISQFGAELLRELVAQHYRMGP